MCICNSFLIFLSLRLSKWNKFKPSPFTLVYSINISENFDIFFIEFKIFVNVDILLKIFSPKINNDFFFFIKLIENFLILPWKSFKILKIFNVIIFLIIFVFELKPKCKIFWSSIWFLNRNFRFKTGFSIFISVDIVQQNSFVFFIKSNDCLLFIDLK